MEKVIGAVEKARNASLARIIPAMGVPMVGKTAGKRIHKYFKGDARAFIAAVDDGFDFHALPNFGDVMCENLAEFFANAENGAT